MENKGKFNFDSFKKTAAQRLKQGDSSLQIDWL